MSDKIIKKRKKAKNNSYNADSINTLSDIEHIRLRPSMYVYDDDEAGYYHIAKEIIDNSLDECLGGFADNVSITLDDDGKGMTVSDNGRGIPFDINKKTGESALITVFSQSRAGAKFNSDVYKVSSGLHGIGATATNALSEVFTAEVKRDNKVAKVSFNYGIVANKGKLEIVADKKQKGTGTTIHFRPDPLIFKHYHDGYAYARLKSRLEEVSYLTRGIKINIKKSHESKLEVFQSDAGLLGLVKSKLGKSSLKVTPFEAKFNIDCEIKDGKSRAEVDLVLSWNGNMHEYPAWYSFVNLTPTQGNGTHVSGIESAIGGTLLSLANGKCTLNELFRGMRGSVHIRHPEPKFKGQTKDVLVNKDIKAEIKDKVEPLFKQWVAENKKFVGSLIEASIALRQSNSMSKELKSVLKEIRKPKNARGLLPKKLMEADCTPFERELYVVEGDSAGGSVGEARDASFQEVLFLKGKVINSVRVSLARTLANSEIRDMVICIGTGIGAEFDINNCRLDKLILMPDADPDGLHIASLLLGFLATHMPELIEHKKVYMLESPLFSAKVTGKNKNYYGNTIEEIRENAGKDWPRCEVGRLKGHGEANVDDVEDYAMNKDTRSLILVTQESATLRNITAIMGEDVTARKKLLGISI